MKNWSLQKRALFMVLAPLTVAVLLLALQQFTNARIQDLEQALHDRGQALAARLASACEEAIATRNRKRLAELIQPVLKEKNVLSVTVTDMGGSIRARADVDEKDKSPVTDGTRYKFLAPIYHVESTTSTAPRPNDMAEPRKQIGLVSVTLSRAALQTEQNRILFQSLFMVVLGLAVTVVFALRMARTVTRHPARGIGPKIAPFAPTAPPTIGRFEDVTGTASWSVASTTGIALPESDRPYRSSWTGTGCVWSFTTLTDAFPSFSRSSSAVRTRRLLLPSETIGSVEPSAPSISLTR